MREEHTAMAVLDMMPAGIDALPPEASTTPRRLRPRGPQALPPTLGEEIDSLSGELLRTYEELHLLYDLGEALTGQLPLAAAAYLILDRIVNTLHPAWAELHL
jgi:hypothetical protein